MKHLDRLRELPCVVHYLMFMEQKVPSGPPHHLEFVRDEMTDYAAIPICPECHSWLHRESRRGFERQTKLTPIDLLAGTVKLLMENRST